MCPSNPVACNNLGMGRGGVPWITFVCDKYYVRYAGRVYGTGGASLVPSRTLMSPYQVGHTCMLFSSTAGDETRVVHAVTSLVPRLPFAIRG